MSQAPVTSSGPWTLAWRRLKRNRAAIIGLFIVVLMALLAVFGPLLIKLTYGYTYESISGPQFTAPCLAHPFGTDIHGRDLLVRVLHGARVSLAVGLVGAFVSLSFGVIYGMVSGYSGGKVDETMMRFVDILYAMPRLVFVIVLIAALDKSVVRLLDFMHLSDYSGYGRIILLFIGLGIVEWLTMSRIVRGQVLALKERQFVMASRSLGASTPRIIFRHLLPNLVGVVITYMTLTVPVVILEESFLSFLGLGIQAPLSSWGSLIADGASVINPITSYWWILVFPAATMTITLLSLNFLGDGLRDVFDPKSQK
ncbi:MAG: ABC transporter permease [Verrucomicrobiota bacterium]|nr:ABC transporter permease [Verrucomicrobiota bacterium]